jgi:hypothetical protein
MTTRHLTDPQESARSMRSPAAQVTDAREERSFRWLLSALLVLAGTLAGFVAAKSENDQTATAAAHVTGACVALEMSAAFGALDDVRYRQVVNAMTSALNPHQYRVPVTYRQVMARCAEVRSN